jgi:TRAP transporter 4TM/12TM fusion protein
MFTFKVNTKPFIGATAVAWSLFQLYTGFFGVLAPLQQRSIHLAFAMVLGFLLTSIKGKSSTQQIGIDQILGAIGSIIIGAYISWNHMELSLSVGNYTEFEIVLSGIGIILLMDVTRRLTGWALTIIGTIFMGYEIVGSYMPAIIQHPGIDVPQMLTFQFMTTEGVFGTAVEVSASFIFLFILYARFLQETGGGQIFIDLASSLVGHVRGGPAKIAVLGSCFFGSISGSAVANVAGTGTFTIPLMKKTGYSNHFAGAVEAVASSGGQFMPPIMGSAAFLISEILAIPYWKVALYAAVPAVLYYLAVFFMVDFEAAKLKLTGLPKSELPKASKVLKNGWPALLSPIVLVVLLAVLQWSPAKSAVWAIVVTILVTMLKPEMRMNYKRMYTTLNEGAISAIDTAIACGAVGVVVGSIMQTGLALKLSSVLVTLAGGSIAGLLLLTMFASLVLGMGLPTVACYLVLAVMVAPALINMGVVPIAAHLFIFYFGIISNITPPVALASYVAAGIADASFMKTSVTACKLGASAFILPFMFAYNPAMVLQGSLPEILQCIFTATIGVFALSVAFEGYFMTALPKWQSLLFGTASILLIIPEFYTDVAGIVLFGVMTFIHYTQTKSARVTSIQ